MKNEAGLAVHWLSTRRDADTPHRNGPYWLTKRRDGASDVWVVAWYEADTRQVRYRSTKSRELEAAKAFLDLHATQNPLIGEYRNPHYRESTSVYFVGGEIGAIKIGATHDPLGRLRTLQCGSPIPLRLLAVVSGGHPIEREYHRRFKAHRLHGEWFDRHPDILAEIERLSA